MLAVPEPSADTRPEPDTVATLVLSEDHVAATTSVEPSALLAVAVAVVVSPVNKLDRPSVTVSDVGGCGVGVDGLSFEQPPRETSRIATEERRRVIAGKPGESTLET
jgi:hypothetical protein